MTELQFFCPCVPPTVTFQAKRIVRVGRFSRLADKPELVQARAFLETVLLPHQPLEPIAGPVCVAMTITWPWLSTHSKKVRALGRIPKRSKPDCSNLGKTIEDRLAALRFIDADENVVDLRVRKFFGDEPGISVRISAVDAQGPPVGDIQPEGGR